MAHQLGEVALDALRLMDVDSGRKEDDGIDEDADCQPRQGNRADVDVSRGGREDEQGRKTEDDDGDTEQDRDRQPQLGAEQCREVDLAQPGLLLELLSRRPPLSGAARLSARGGDPYPTWRAGWV